MVSQIICQRPNALSCLLFSLRVCPVKCLVTQQPDEGPQTTRLLVGDGTETPALLLGSRGPLHQGLGASPAHWPHTAPFSRMSLPPTIKWAGFALISLLLLIPLSLSARKSWLLPLRFSLSSWWRQQGQLPRWCKVEREGGKQSMNGSGLCLSRNQIRVFLNVRSLTSRTFVKCLKFP